MYTKCVDSRRSLWIEMILLSCDLDFPQEIACTYMYLNNALYLITYFEFIILYLRLSDGLRGIASMKYGVILFLFFQVYELLKLFAFKTNLFHSCSHSYAKVIFPFQSDVTSVESSTAVVSPIVVPDTRENFFDLSGLQTYHLLSVRVQPTVMSSFS